jgi:MFS family permease
VGRLIMIRTFPKGELLAALSLVSIPALIGPTVGPVVGGFLTSYISWRWIFYVNIPIGIIGIVLALRHIRDFPIPPPPRFDFRGFILVGFGLVMLEFAIEYVGRHLLPQWAEVSLFLGAGILLALYILHAQATPDPVLDLKLFRLRVFRIAWSAGGLCHIAIGALPFLLPLMLQVGFGLDPLHSGLLTFVTGIGAIMLKTIATRVAKFFGFRRLLVFNSVLLGLMIGGIGFFQPATPHWLLLLYLFLYGVIRATQFTNIQALGYSELTPPIMSKGTSITSVIQQLCNSFGVAAAASALALVVGPEAEITLADFRMVFVLIGLLPILSMLGFLRLRPDDGAEVSGRAKTSAS